MTKEEEDFRIMQSPFGPRRVYVGGADRLVYNWTAEGLAQIDEEITKREAAERDAAACSTTKTCEAT
jgi:hypothetical protein